LAAPHVEADAVDHPAPPWAFSRLCAAKQPRTASCRAASRRGRGRLGDTFLPRARDIGPPSEVRSMSCQLPLPAFRLGRGRAAVSEQCEHVKHALPQMAIVVGVKIAVRLNRGSPARGQRLSCASFAQAIKPCHWLVAASFALVVMVATYTERAALWTVHLSSRREIPPALPWFTA